MGLGEDSRRVLEQGSRAKFGVWALGPGSEGAGPGHWRGGVGVWRQFKAAQSSERSLLGASGEPEGQVTILAALAPL